MDFSNRGVQPQPTAPGAHTAAVGSSNTTKKGRVGRGKGMRIINAVLVGAVLILLIALIAFIGFGGNNVNNEDKYVDSNRLQAVFLNTGQVYFGNVKVLNSKYVVLSNIYYLQTSNTGSSSSSTSASSANTNVTLVKLGCELHQPYDQMVINRTQVTFWENLQASGQVAKAVSTFQKQNPSGQKCADQTSSSSSTTNTVQNANGNNSATPTTTTKKP